MLKSTYIGETSRGGPEKKYDQDRVHSVLISKKLLAWCSGEVSEWRFSTLASCVSGCKGNEKDHGELTDWSMSARNWPGGN